MKIDASRRGILTGRWRKASNGIRPPWSGDESHFLTHCTRCDACINACENNILQRGAGGYPLWGVARGDARMMASSRLFAWLLFMSVAGAFLVLVNAFVVNDFTVTYVASNSNTQLPVWYRVAATWGAHEGSLLLWVLLMSGWTFAVAIFSQRIPLDIVARVLAICMGWLRSVRHEIIQRGNYGPPG